MARTFSDKVADIHAKNSNKEKLDYRPNPQPPLNPADSVQSRIDRLLAGARAFDTYKEYLDSHYDKYDDELDYDDSNLDPDGFELSKYSEDYEAYQHKIDSEVAELKAHENAEEDFKREVAHKKRVKKALADDTEVNSTKGV